MFVNMGQQNLRRGTMSVFILIILLLVEKQADAGDLHPEQIGASIQIGSFMASTTLNDQMHNFTASDKAQNDNDIAWFKTKIVDKYGFLKDGTQDEWKQQGDFSKELATADFKTAADRALAFFENNPNWSQTKALYRNPSTGKCLELLYITAARYLLVTYILWEQSERRLTQCRYSPDKKLEIPDTVCYPMPYGSATCTSDYDVGLIGKDAGYLVKNFNDYFENESKFKKPSEEVFDTNAYAFTLEYAMPAAFAGLPPNFAESVAEQEKTPRFRMQELVSAYYKVFKYNQGYFNKLMSTAKATLKNTAELNEWDQKFSRLHKDTPLMGPDIRLTHNHVYGERVKRISDREGYGNLEQNLEDLAVALLYAAEAYHTRGAIRHVVGGLQMKIAKYSASQLHWMDVWVSMIENWGETLKEYNHGCFDEGGKPVILEVCLVKMSKYMWRMLAAMKVLRDIIRARQPTKQTALANLICFPGELNPEEIMRWWLDAYKRRGKDRVYPKELLVNNFFSRFECENVRFGTPLPPNCVTIMNNKVDAYNEKMAEIFSKVREYRERLQAA